MLQKLQAEVLARHYQNATVGFPSVSQDDIRHGLNFLVFWATQSPESTFLVPYENVSRLASETYEVDTAANSTAPSVNRGGPPVHVSR